MSQRQFCASSFSSTRLLVNLFLHPDRFRFPTPKSQLRLSRVVHWAVRRCFCRYLSSHSPVYLQAFFLVMEHGEGCDEFRTGNIHGILGYLNRPPGPEGRSCAKTTPFWGRTHSCAPTECRNSKVCGHESKSARSSIKRKTKGGNIVYSSQHILLYHECRTINFE